MDSHNDERSGRGHYDDAASAALVYAEKQRIVAASLERGAVAFAVAREAGIQVSQFFRWRQETLPAGRSASGKLCGGVAGAGFGAGAANPSWRR